MSLSFTGSALPVTMRVPQTQLCFTSHIPRGKGWLFCQTESLLSVSLAGPRALLPTQGGEYTSGTLRPQGCCCYYYYYYLIFSGNTIMQVPGFFM